MNGTTVFFDFETGGVEDRHPNIQIAAVAVHDWNEIDAFERKIQFDPAQCDPEALRINGWKAQAWSVAVSEDDAAIDFCAFLNLHATMTLTSKRGKPYQTCRLAGHNVASFDGPRLRRMMDRGLGGAFWPGCWWYPLDTYQRAIWHFTERGLALPANFQLQTLGAHFGIPPAGAAHDALADVRLCVQIAKALLAEGGET